MVDIPRDAARLDVGQVGRVARPVFRAVPPDVGHHHLLVRGLALAGVDALGPHGHLVEGENLEVGHHEGGLVLGDAVERGEGRVDGLGITVHHRCGVDGRQDSKQKKKF